MDTLRGRTNDYVGERMLRWEQPGKRPRRRPKRRFIDAVKRDRRLDDVSKEHTEEMV